jgi:hypothetical protein
MDCFTYSVLKLLSIRALALTVKRVWAR